MHFVFSYKGYLLLVLIYDSVIVANKGITQDPGSNVDRMHRKHTT